MNTQSEIKNNKAQLSQYLYVVRQLVKRDLGHKNSGKKLGRLWNILNPFINMIVLSMIFTTIFKSNIEHFPIYILTGTIVYGLFSEGTNSSLNALVSNKKFLIKSKLPKRLFVIEKIYVAFINFLYSMIGYVALLIVFRIPFSPTFFLVPLDIFIFIIMIMGISEILAVINVYFADISHFYKIFLTLIFYASAIFFVGSRLSPVMQHLLGYNPVYLTITIARISILDAQLPPLSLWIKLISYTVGFVLLGELIWRKGTQDVIAKL